MKELETSLDWKNVEQEIRQLIQTAPEFKFDVIKFCSAIGSEVKKLGDIEIEIRRRPSDGLLVKHKDQCKKINNAIKDFSSIHLLHLFTRTD